MVFDAQRILAEQFRGEAFYDRRGGLGEAEESGFADAFQTRVGSNADKSSVVDDEGFDGFDLH